MAEGALVRRLRPLARGDAAGDFVGLTGATHRHRCAETQQAQQAWQDRRQEVAPGELEVWLLAV